MLSRGPLSLSLAEKALTLLWYKCCVFVSGSVAGPVVRKFEKETAFFFEPARIPRSRREPPLPLVFGGAAGEMLFASACLDTPDETFWSTVLLWRAEPFSESAPHSSHLILDVIDEISALRVRK